MSKMQHMPIVFTGPDSMYRATIVEIDAKGFAKVRLGDNRIVSGCSALHLNGARPNYVVGAEVLVWVDQTRSGEAVVLGCIGPAGGEEMSGTATPAGSKPKTLVLEADEEIVIRNQRAKIRIDAKGDIELVCNNLAARGQRLLRLLAPLIKLN